MYYLETPMQRRSFSVTLIKEHHNKVKLNIDNLFQNKIGCIVRCRKFIKIKRLQQISLKATARSSRAENVFSF
jgi:hypothetical protein